jgi:hypothetical protein
MKRSVEITASGVVERGSIQADLREIGSRERIERNGRV